MKRALFVLLVLSAQTPSGRAVAQAPSAEMATENQTRVVLVVGQGVDDVANRFAAELSSLRFEVLSVADTAEPPTQTALESLARDKQARAAVRVAAAEGAIDLWLVNPTTHEALYRRIVAEQDPAVAVLRSLEILRGSLVDLRALAPEPVATPAAPQRVAPAPAPARPTRAAWFGLNAAASALDVQSAPAWGALAGFHLAVVPKFWLHAEALVPLSESHVSGQGGRVSAWAGVLALGGSIAPLGERTLTPALGLGVGALALHTRGEPAAGFRGTSDLNVFLFPHARLETTLKLSLRLRLRAQILGGFAVPRPVLLLADERNAAWLNPLLSGALGLDVSLN